MYGVYPARLSIAVADVESKLNASDPLEIDAEDVALWTPRD